VKAQRPIRSVRAGSFSFRALVSQELGRDGQVITLFHLSEVTVQRPVRLHVDFRGRGKEVDLFSSPGLSVLYTPQEKLYAVISTPATIAAALEVLKKHNVSIPIRNFLESDPYQPFTDDCGPGTGLARSCWSCCSRRKCISSLSPNRAPSGSCG